MKKLIALVPVMVTLVGCATTAPIDKQAEVARERQVAAQQFTVKSAPDWFTTPPASTDTVVYATGTAASFNWAMADRTATDLALGKLCVSVGGKVSQQSKVYQREDNTSSQEFSETAVKSMCPQVDVRGYVIQSKKQAVDPNGKIRVFILIAYPLPQPEAPVPVEKGPEADRNVDSAFKELDAVTNSVTVRDKNGKVQELELMDVENPEAVAKRREALAKPGAVYGRTQVPF